MESVFGERYMLVLICFFMSDHSETFLYTAYILPRYKSPRPVHKPTLLLRYFNVMVNLQN